jgi:hypothetical protein
VVLDNYFSSIGLFIELLANGTYATGTMRSNRVGLPLVLKDTKSFKRVPQGTLDWRMHESRRISCVLWKNKRPVLLISTHSIPAGLSWHGPKVTVPRRNDAV